MTTRTQGDRVPSKISKDLRALGADLYSTCVGFKYPRNGNVHNPTPELLYVGTYKGQVVTRQRRARDAKEVLAAHIDAAKPKSAAKSAPKRLMDRFRL